MWEAQAPSGRAGAVVSSWRAGGGHTLFLVWLGPGRLVGLGPGRSRPVAP